MSENEYIIESFRARSWNEARKYIREKYGTHRGFNIDLRFIDKYSDYTFIYYTHNEQDYLKYKTKNLLKI